MIYLYAGLGMAMMAAIVGMMEVATQLTSQPFRSVPKVDAYKSSTAQTNDQRFLELLSTLAGESLGTQDVLCERLMCEIGDAGRCLPSQVPGRFFVDLADYAISSSNSLSHPRLINACILTNRKLSHRILISPVSDGSDDYRLYSCIITPQHPDKCIFEDEDREIL